jgi:hypothetical protein
MDLFDANILRLRVILRQLVVVKKYETRLDVAMRTLNLAGTLAI